MASDNLYILAQKNDTLSTLQNGKLLSSSTTTTTTTTTRQNDIIELRGYAEDLELPMSGTVERLVRGYLIRGMHKEVIKRAMEQTALAPRPSWRYTLAILQRCVADKAMTPEGWAAREARHQEAKAQRSNALYDHAKEPKTPFNYTQRQYTNEEYNAIFADLDELLKEGDD